MPDADGAPRPAAGVVLFRPDANRLLALVAALLPQVPALYLFANGPLDPEVTRALGDAAPDAIRIESECNQGIATALNALAERAERDGHALLLVFDQDSRIESGHATGLSRAHRALVAAGERPAAIGPVPDRGAETADHKAPRYPAVPGRSEVAGCRPVWFLATSGTLLDLAAWRDVGRFRDEYFIDAVDTEWGFRAWRCGFSCWVEPRVSMLHRVGEGVIGSRLLGVHMPRQKPFRMETYLRNSVHGWRLPHIPLGWKLRQAAYLPVQVLLFWIAHRGDPMTLARLLRGIGHGLSGRLGRPPGLP